MHAVRLERSGPVAAIERHVAPGGVGGSALGALRGERPLVEDFASDAGRGLPAGAAVACPPAATPHVLAAAAVMRLVELGELTVNTPVWAILPDFRGEARDDVRVRHLITHTTGLPYESPLMGERLAAHWTTDELIDEAYEAPFLFAPGTRF